MMGERSSHRARQQDDSELDDKIDSLAMMLDTTELKSMDWADTMICAPIAIGIIGECLLLSSHRRASSIELSSSRLKATSLPANLHQLAITGKGAFSESASRMRKICSQASMLSKNGSGIIDNIMNLACAEQTPVVTRALESQKKNLRTVVGRCTEDSEALQREFQKWKEETLVLFDALSINTGETIKKVDEVGLDLVNTENALERLKKELGFDDMNLDKIEARLLERKQLSEATAVAGAPIISTAMLLALLGSSVSGPLAFGASVAVLGHAAWARSTQVKRDKQVIEFQEKSLKAQNLDQQVQRLNSASITLKEIEEIVEQAVRQIYDLQNQVDNLLRFFKAVFESVESLDTLQAKQLEEDVSDNENMHNDTVKKLVMDNALNLKISFIFIGHLAKMYSQVSSKYLLPGMHTVQMLGLSDDSKTPAQREWKKRELQDFKRDSVEGVRRMTMDQQDQLNAEMRPLIKQGLLSLRTVTA